MSPPSLLTLLPSGTIQAIEEEPVRDTPHGERLERLGGLTVALFTIVLALELSLRF